MLRVYYCLEDKCVTGKVSSRNQKFSKTEKKVVIIQVLGGNGFRLLHQTVSMEFLQHVSDQSF